MAVDPRVVELAVMGVTPEMSEPLTAVGVSLDDVVLLAEACSFAAGLDVACWSAGVSLYLAGSPSERLELADLIEYDVKLQLVAKVLAAGVSPAAVLRHVFLRDLEDVASCLRAGVLPSDIDGCAFTLDGEFTAAVVYLLRVQQDMPDGVAPRLSADPSASYAAVASLRDVGFSFDDVLFLVDRGVPLGDADSEFEVRAPDRPRLDRLDVGVFARHGVSVAALPSGVLRLGAALTLLGFTSACEGLAVAAALDGERAADSLLTLLADAASAGSASRASLVDLLVTARLLDGDGFVDPASAVRDAVAEAASAPSDGTAAVLAEHVPLVHVPAIAAVLAARGLLPEVPDGALEAWVPDVLDGLYRGALGVHLRAGSPVTLEAASLPPASVAAAAFDLALASDVFLRFPAYVAAYAAAGAGREWFASACELVRYADRQVPLEVSLLVATLQARGRGLEALAPEPVPSVRLPARPGAASSRSRA